MKRLMIVGLLIMISFLSFAQPTPSTAVPNKEYYLKKSKSQKTTYYILAGVGSATLFTGVIIAVVDLSHWNDESYTDNNSETVAETLSYGGAALIVTSIPLFIMLLKII